MRKKDINWFHIKLNKSHLNNKIFVKNLIFRKEIGQILYSV